MTLSVKHWPWFVLLAVGAAFAYWLLPRRVKATVSVGAEGPSVRYY